VLFGQHGAGEAFEGFGVGEDPDDVGRGVLTLTV